MHATTAARRSCSAGALGALLPVGVLLAAPADVAGRRRGDAAATRDAVRALLKQGADVNAAQGDGMTALHWAAMSGDAELAQMLLYAGANVQRDDAPRRATRRCILAAQQRQRGGRSRRCSKAGADVERADHAPARRR